MTSCSGLAFQRRTRSNQRYRVAAIVTLLAVFLGPAWADPPLQVSINSCAATTATVTGFVGDFPGTTTGAMRQFLGIRYAAPPIGKNRWQPPKPRCWTNNRSATAFGAICPQPGTSGSEDCLFLNIFTPANGNYSKLPVMVFIHGGGYLRGAGSFYNPINLVNDRVIVVTMNYRLGALGFLAHPALDNAATKNTGMYGILDQQAALRWVKANIANFGGDPARVTIFGQSAGAFSVVVHLVSPLSKGLFQRAIIQSGANYFQTSMADAESAGEAFATRAGCSSQNVSCLRALPVSTILAAQDAPSNTTLFLKLDSVVIKQDMKTSLSSGAFAKVPIINGTTHDEQRFLLLGDSNLGSGDNCHFESKITPQNYANLLPLEFFGLASQVNQQYPPGPSDLTANSQYMAAHGDRDFACHALHFDTWVAQNGGKLFAYEFNDRKSPPIEAPIKLANGATFPYGAYHAVDLQYFFRQGSTIACGLPYAGLSPAQQTLDTSMVKYWTTFAKTGNPNPAAGIKPPEWPVYSDTAQMLSLAASTPTAIASSAFDQDHKCSAFWWNYIP